ncbi:hypothetical protein ACWC3X_28625 [Streptomyces populi]
MSVAVAGLAMWLAQGNGHGLVACCGFVLGLAVLSVARRLPRRFAAVSASATGEPSRAGAGG